MQLRGGSCPLSRQGVYNFWKSWKYWKFTGILNAFWKYWKSSGILIVPSEKFYIIDR